MESKAKTYTNHGENEECVILADSKKEIYSRGGYRMLRLYELVIDDNYYYVIAENKDEAIEMAMQYGRIKSYRCIGTSIKEKGVYYYG